MQKYIDLNQSVLTTKDYKRALHKWLKDEQQKKKNLLEQLRGQYK